MLRLTSLSSNGVSSLIMTVFLEMLFVVLLRAELLRVEDLLRAELLRAEDLLRVEDLLRADLRSVGLLPSLRF